MYQNIIASAQFSQQATSPPPPSSDSSLPLPHHIHYSLCTMNLLPSVLWTLMVAVASALEFTVIKVKQQELQNRASFISASSRETTVNATTNAQDELDIRCVVSLWLSLYAKQNSSSIHDLIYLANVSSAQLLINSITQRVNARLDYYRRQ